MSNRRAFNPNKKALKLLWGLNKRWFLFVAVSSVITAWMPLLAVFFASETVNILSQAENLVPALIIVLAMAFLLFLVSLLKSILLRKTINEETRLRQQEALLMQQKLMNLRYEDLENPETRQQRRKIEEASRINNFGLGRLRDAFAGMISQTATFLGSIVFFGDLLFRGLFLGNGGPDYIATIAVAGAMSLVVAEVFAVRHAEKKTAEHGNEVSALMIEENRIDEAVDSYNMGKDVRLYGLKDIIMSIKNYALKTHRKAFGLMYSISFRTNTPVRIIFYVSQSLMGFAILRGIYSGNIEAGSIIRYFSCAEWMVMALLGMIQMSNALTFNMPFVADSLSYLDLPGEAVSKSYSPATMPSLHRDFEMVISNVSFCYPGTDEYVLNNVNLTIHSGESLSIVGTNGSGKTTLVKLICRLYSPSKGGIYLNGVNIHDIPIDIYRRELAVLFQDFKLFPFSIEENIFCGSKNDPVLLHESLRKAGIDAMIASLPLGSQTPLYKEFSESGLEISGGEAQKIALARAFSRKAGLLILDEPTAALDPLAEADIMESVYRETKSQTVVYISHRLSTTRFSDHIAVLDKGELVQYGKHEDLIKIKDGQYYALWNAQASFYS